MLLMVVDVSVCGLIGCVVLFVGVLRRLKVIEK